MKGMESNLHLLVLCSFTGERSHAESGSSFWLYAAAAKLSLRNHASLDFDGYLLATSSSTNSSPVFIVLKSTREVPYLIVIGSCLPFLWFLVLDPGGI